METVIKKWGNSLGVRIPGFIVKDLSLKDGSFVEIEEEGDKIVIKQKKKVDLNEMLKNIDINNLHGEIETEAPEGKEIW